MRQRLGLANALLRPRQLLVLDEPTNGMDPQGTREIRHLIRDLAADGTTVFLSSHLLAEIEQVCTPRGGDEPSGGSSRRARSTSCGPAASRTLHVETDDAALAAEVLAGAGLEPSSSTACGSSADLGDGTGPRSCAGRWSRPASASAASRSSARASRTRSWR